MKEKLKRSEKESVKTSVVVKKSLPSFKATDTFLGIFVISKTALNMSVLTCYRRAELGGYHRTNRNADPRLAGRVLALMPT